MCGGCIPSLERAEQYEREMDVWIDNPSLAKFENWNTSTLGFCFQLAYGMCGQANQKKAIKTLELFLTWAEQQPQYAKQLGPTQMELMPPLLHLGKCLEYFKKQEETYRNNFDQKKITENFHLPDPTCPRVSPAIKLTTFNSKASADSFCSIV